MLLDFLQTCQMAKSYRARRSRSWVNLYAQLGVGDGRPSTPGGLAVLLSAKSSFSALSFWSVGSILSVGSVLSIGSAGSVLSIGSAGSILSIGSAGSILSIGSAGSILSIGGAGASPRTDSEEPGPEEGS